MLLVYGGQWSSLVLQHRNCSAPWTGGHPHPNNKPLSHPKCLSSLQSVWRHGRRTFQKLPDHVEWLSLLSVSEWWSLGSSAPAMDWGMQNRAGVPRELFSWEIVQFFSLPSWLSWFAPGPAWWLTVVLPLFGILQKRLRMSFPQILFLVNAYFLLLLSLNDEAASLPLSVCSSHPLCITLLEP